MKHEESHIQISCVRWFRLRYPKKIIFAIPNGGKRGIITATIMKNEGVLAGIPDLFIPEPTHDYHGLFIEMKKPKGIISPAQKEIIKDLKDRNYRVEVCYSFDEFIQIVDNYLRF